MFRPIAAIFKVLTTFLLKDFYKLCLNRVVMLRSHHQFTCFFYDIKSVKSLQMKTHGIYRKQPRKKLISGLACVSHRHGGWDPMLLLTYLLTYLLHGAESFLRS